MEEENEKSRQFNLEDFNDVKFDPNWSRMDCLAAVAGHVLYLQKQKMTATEKMVEKRNDHLQKKIKRRFFGPEVIKKSDLKVAKEDANGQKTRKLGPNRFCPSPSAPDEDNREKSEEEEEEQEEEEDEEEEERNRNKRQRKNTAGASSSSPSPPQLPQEFRTALERFAAGKRIRELNLVLRKHIYKTDISSTHSRLSLPKNKQEHSFLTEEEENYLKWCDFTDDGKKVSHSMEVDVIDPSLELCKLELKNWAISKGMYVLTKDWNNLVKRNDIRMNQTIHVWTVRVDQKLLFILVRVPEEAAAEQD